MAGLVEEIQTKVLDRTVTAVELLRMVKLAATKLSLDATSDWVDYELKGYPNEVTVPDYREATGEIKVHNPYLGPQSVGGDPEFLRKLGKRTVRAPMSEVIALTGDGAGQLLSKLPMEVINAINKSNGSPHMDYYVHLPVAFFINMQEQVRNLILEWATNLELQGIIGEGISFTVEEKKRAANAGTIINIGTVSGHLHHGDVTGDQNRASVNSTDYSVNSITTENIFTQLTQAIDSSVSNQNDREAMLAIIREMEKSKGTADYVPWFQKLVGYLADYATVLGPFLPTLGGFAGG